MKTKLIKAIKELSKYYPEFKRINLDEVNDDQNINEALLYLVNYVNGKDIEIKSDFDTFGVIIDLSRNAVFKVEYLKEVIRKHALLGYNKIMLYTEDVYEVDDEPYFGYMRGKYAKEEIQEIVEYAEIFNIEMIPCIQTLGHMEQFLRWNYNYKLKDQKNVLMTEIDEVYDFIEKCIVSLRKMYKTNKIHIGLDETFGLALGRYYKIFGHKNQYEVFVNHLRKVNDICLKHGFQDVLIWSDMFFRISSVSEAYYDLEIKVSEKLINDIPENVILVYWDYYNEQDDIVQGMIKKHLEISKKTIMASGTWIWTKLAYDKMQTDKTALTHIDVCKTYGLKEIYFTQWNDDGAPCNYDTVFLGLFDLTNYAFTNNQMSKKVYEYITKLNYDESLILAKINESPIYPVSLLWEDPLLGIYLNNELARNPNIFDEGLTFFKSYIDELKSIKHHDFAYNHALIIAKLLYNKILIRKELIYNYRQKKSLLSIIPICEEAIKLTDKLLLSFREMWLSRYKAFGLDVIQSRLATLMYRFREVIMRINDYENKKITKIDELEEKIGPHQYIHASFKDIAYSSVGWW